MKYLVKAGLLAGVCLMGGSLGVYAENTKVLPLDIKFETNKAEIRPGTPNDQEFQKVASELKNYPYARVEIEGYADATGPEAFNNKLSAERAEAVRQRFIQLYNIGPDRIQAVGKGEKKPAATNVTEEGRRENRRVIATIYRLEPGATRPDGHRL